MLLMLSTSLSRRDDDVGDPPIASIPMEEVSLIVNGHRRGSGAMSGPGRRNGSRTMGRGGATDPLPSPLGKSALIVFVEDDALYWTKRRCCGAVSDSDEATTMGGGGNDDGRHDCRNADNVFRGPGRTTALTTSMGGRGLCLRLQFAHALFLLHLNDDDGRAAGGRTENNGDRDMHTTINLLPMKMTIPDCHRPFERCFSHRIKTTIN